MSRLNAEWRFLTRSSTDRRDHRHGGGNEVPNEAISQNSNQDNQDDLDDHAGSEQHPKLNMRWSVRLY
jgi:hypothetical protein